MRWEVEVRDKSAGTARIYLIQGELDEAAVRRLATDLLTDPLIESFALQPAVADTTVTVLPRPGVMDPVAQTVETAIRDLGYAPARVRTGRRYFFPRRTDPQALLTHARKHLANEVVEEVLLGPLPQRVWTAEPQRAPLRVVHVPLRQAGDEELLAISRQGQLALNLDEMRAIRDHFRNLGRDPTDVELETLAQTWSEHCSHKTLRGAIEWLGTDGGPTYDNLLEQTIFHATREIRRRLGAQDWCVSVFADNAGVVRFDDRFHVCFKVETHNHPSAIEPYGGASTGVGGVIRDVLGTGLGGKPICNTDVFCFAPPDYPEDRLPPGVLHPARMQQGVVAGVRDYGNRMGIPTVNGAICYDLRYLANPLVFCGTVGLIPVGMESKSVAAGDLIVLVGGRTGRDGIHGATFSSLELTHRSEELSGSAVQIGNAITEKKLLDVLLQARDRRLYRAITDCGAGGLSSAVGEMGASVGAEVHLDQVPLKYAGLTYCEIWISESQERMVLAVPPECWPELQRLCQAEDVEAAVIGTFADSGKLRLYCEGTQVADLDMHFLHRGRPKLVRKASVPAPAPAARGELLEGHGWRDVDHGQILLKLLGSWNVCSKEVVIRQYDHEVQALTVLKPLVGAGCDGPGDAAVLAPVAGSTRGLAIGCGINPRYGELDPYRMAAACVDEAVRNVVAVGADPSRIALLDNFCWGNTDRPEVLGSLVRAAEACRDVAIALGTPFISGKDSLNNEFKAEGWHLVIPPTLLISAVGLVPDVRRCLSMDLKEAGNLLYLVGATRAELGGSQFALATGSGGGVVPRVDLLLAPRLFQAIHTAIQQGWLRACHDLSEGGLAVAVAEMAFAGGLGAAIFLDKVPLDDYEPLEHPEDRRIVALYAESTSRFLCEVPPEQASAWESHMRQEGLPIGCIGQVVAEPRLTIYDRQGPSLVCVADLPLEVLKEAWQAPLRRVRKLAEAATVGQGAEPA